VATLQVAGEEQQVTSVGVAVTAGVRAPLTSAVGTENGPVAEYVTEVVDTKAADDAIADDPEAGDDHASADNTKAADDHAPGHDAKPADGDKARATDRGKQSGDGKESDDRKSDVKSPKNKSWRPAKSWQSDDTSPSPKAPRRLHERAAAAAETPSEKAGSHDAGVDKAA
jgi:hypothetical protein